LKHALFPLSELEPGQMKAAVVDGLEVVVARDLDGTVYALRDRCAHSAARLSRGRLLEKVVGNDVDQYELADELVLRCPWHGFEYELPTGRCIADPKRMRVKAYPVTVEDGTIWLEKAAARERRTGELD
jgi:3-phenylpropionate/trans-cinnamate dioxygenase ferredoxin subunit